MTCTALFAQHYRKKKKNHVRKDLTCGKPILLFSTFPFDKKTMPVSACDRSLVERFRAITTQVGPHSFTGAVSSAVQVCQISSKVRQDNRDVPTARFKKN